MGRRAEQAERLAEWRTGDPPLTITITVTEPWLLAPLADGASAVPGERTVTLLFTEEVAALTLKPDDSPIEASTVRWYNAAADTMRRNGEGIPEEEGGFPAPHAYVRRTTRKSNGQPSVAVTPVWRADKIGYWTTHRPRPGRNFRSETPARLVEAGDGSDVEMVRVPYARTVECVGCDLNTEHRASVSFDSVDAAAAHLRDHVVAGDVVPESARGQVLAERANVGPARQAG